jgi:hypothetical protein
MFILQTACDALYVFATTVYSDYFYDRAPKESILEILSDLWDTTPDTAAADDAAVDIVPKPPLLLVIGKSTPSNQKDTPQMRYIRDVTEDARTKNAGAENTHGNLLEKKIIYVEACSDVISRTLEELQSYFQKYRYSNQEQKQITQIITAHGQAGTYTPSTYVVWIDQDLQWIEPIGSWSQLKIKLQFLDKQPANPLYTRYQETYCDGCGSHIDKTIMCATLKGLE